MYYAPTLWHTTTTTTTIIIIIISRLKEAINVSDKLRTEAKKNCGRRSDKVKLSGLERQLFQ
jgi:hypothetical protein